MPRKSNSREQDLDTTANQFASLQIQIDKLIEVNKELRTEVKESIKATEFISKKYDENENNMKNILEKLDKITDQNKDIIEKNNLLEKQLQDEKRERVKLEERVFQILNSIEIEKREKNLKLHGLPEQEEENSQEVVQEIISKVTARPVKMETCFRYGRKTNPNGEERTRPIMIKFENKAHKDEVYKNRTNLKKMEQRLYLNENLPQYLNVLKGKANSIRRQKEYKFLWTKNGNILLRKQEGSTVINIRSTSDLEKIV